MLFCCVNLAVPPFPGSQASVKVTALVSTTEVYCLTVLEARRPKAKCQQSWFWGLGGKACPGPLCLVCGWLSFLCISTQSCLCVYLCPDLLLLGHHSYQTTAHPQRLHFNDYLCKVSISE